MDYKHLKKWITTNPKIVSYANFCRVIGIKPQLLDYYFRTNRPMPQDLIAKTKVAFDLSPKEVDKFFYFVKGYKK